MPVQPRFLLACRCIVEALNDGVRNQKHEDELAKMFIGTYGLSMFAPGVKE